MSLDYDSTFKRIIAKASILEKRYQLMLQSRNEAIARVEELEQRLEERDKVIEQQRRQIEYLQIATTIASTRKQAEASRALITGLIRDIDRCITDLSD